MTALQDEFPPADQPKYGTASYEVHDVYVRIFKAISASPNAPLFSVRQDMARRVWGVIEEMLTAVLAPDEATVERLAIALHDASWSHVPWEKVKEDLSYGPMRFQQVHALLAALADTPAQAGTGQTADDAAGGGEDA